MSMQSHFAIIIEIPFVCTHACAKGCTILHVHNLVGLEWWQLKWSDNDTYETFCTNGSVDYVNVCMHQHTTTMS
mgnify:CR=1 FL=1